LRGRLHHEFADPGLLDIARTHRSWCAENGGVESNERLEFLGDSVLGLVVTDHIYRRYPDLSEGKLAKLRATVVSSNALAGVARELDLGSCLLLGKGELASGGSGKTSILADAMEAMIGAVYLDAGWGAASELVLRLFADRIAEAARRPGIEDFKTRLQEFSARNHETLPDYHIASDGPDHAKRFFAEVHIDGTRYGAGEGRSKKEAEQAAAAAAWERVHEAAASTNVDDVDHDSAGEPAAGAQR
jgi:ribonuclease-3